MVAGSAARRPARARPCCRTPGCAACAGWRGRRASEARARTLFERWADRFPDYYKASTDVAIARAPERPIRPLIILAAGGLLLLTIASLVDQGVPDEGVFLPLLDAGYQKCLPLAQPCVVAGSGSWSESSSPAFA